MSLVNRVGILYISLGRSVGYAHFFWRKFDMAGPSAYVHSNANNAELAVSVDMINQMMGIDASTNGLNFIESTIKKLDILAEQLDSAANQFLDGIPLDTAQAIADNAGNSLVHLANSVLYGSSAYTMMNKLKFDQTLNLQAILNSGNFNGQFGSEVKIIIEEAIRAKMPLTVQRLASLINKEVSGKNTTINVTEAGAIITNLGNIFDVQTFTSIARKGQQVAIDTAFEATRGATLSTKSNGIFRKLMIELMKNSNYMNSNDDLNIAIKRFCDELGELMIKKAMDDIHFLWTDNPKKIELTINEFIRRLKIELPKTLNKNRLTADSNVIGEIGEPVRESISKAANSIIISFQIGDLSDKEGIEKVHRGLAEYKSNNRLSQMISYHDDNKQSFTDLVLLNNRTKQIARAQSKNKFSAYFTKGTDVRNGQIENFRWKIEEAANLFSFLNKLSNTDLGINLNSFDMSNILDAVANNIWFQNQSSYRGTGFNTYEVEQVSVKDFKNEFKQAMEKILAGQVTNFLGVTVAPIGDIKIDSNASNIFYILNGRLKKTADLVREAQLQLDENIARQMGNTLNNNRLINVQIDIDNPGGNGKDFLIEKLHALSGYSNNNVESIGEAKGEEILNSIKISVSLGTNITTLGQSAMIW